MESSFTLSFMAYPKSIRKSYWFYLQNTSRIQPLVIIPHSHHDWATAIFCKHYYCSLLLVTGLASTSNLYSLFVNSSQSLKPQGRHVTSSLEYSSGLPAHLEQKPSPCNGLQSLGPAISPIYLLTPSRIRKGEGLSAFSQRKRGAVATWHSLHSIFMWQSSAKAEESTELGLVSLDDKERLRSSLKKLKKNGPNGQAYT